MTKRNIERRVFDIETDGLLDSMTKIHCLVIIDPTTNVEKSYFGDTLDEGIRELEKADWIIGHNIIGFDIPAIKKLYPDFKYKNCLDTMVTCATLRPNIKNIDMGTKAYKIPPKLIGSHSLEAWGYRIGLNKDDFGKTTDWKEFSDEMLAYCVKDVQVNTKLYHTIRSWPNRPRQALELEHGVAHYCTLQQIYGFMFDLSIAREVESYLSSELNDIHFELVKEFRGWWKCGDVTEVKRTINYKDVTKASRIAGNLYCPCEWVEFKPSSRDHIARVLKEKYGWIPHKLTDTGKAKIDDEVLELLSYPEAKKFGRYLTLAKLYGFISKGKNALLKYYNKDTGRIHGRINAQGAVTARASHSNPNIAQVPSGKKPYGKEFRRMFTVPKGKVLVGVDASGLELRCLAHYIAKFDKGKYGDIVINGDIHTVNQQAAGLPTRDLAKTFIYAFLYGAGDELIGALVGFTDEEWVKWVAKGETKKVGNRLRDRGIRPSKEMVGNIIKGGIVKKQFLDKTPALKKLQESIKKEAKTGYVEALDGRSIPVRSSHSAFNFLLQSAGAIICKHWLVKFNREMEKQGYVFGKDYAQVAWVHDELQIEVTEGLEEVVMETAIKAIRDTGIDLRLNVALDGDGNVGKSWAETH